MKRRDRRNSRSTREMGLATAAPAVAVIVIKIEFLRN